MGGDRTHWLKGGWYGRLWEMENEKEEEKGKRTAEYNGGRWIHHFCDFIGVADSIQSELRALRNLVDHQTTYSPFRWHSGSLAIRQQFGD
ncbi:hypothetical protein G5I_06553 [Acromyrmex echinatior]|uniref:Uncharacterized protein n=1 Tax=Acromyrmex echinatior TaxID=103372 RepID=F4WLC8_ACREC|nr:hypothetical protein G5I_06553 [Acromyrmex echinatior]